MVNIERGRTNVDPIIQNARPNCVIYEKKQKKTKSISFSNYLIKFYDHKKLEY